jgi:hypothetical protein
VVGLSELSVLKDRMSGLGAVMAARPGRAAPAAALILGAWMVRHGWWGGCCRGEASRLAWLHQLQGQAGPGALNRVVHHDVSQGCGYLVVCRYCVVLCAQWQSGSCLCRFVSMGMSGAAPDSDIQLDLESGCSRLRLVIITACTFNCAVLITACTFAQCLLRLITACTFAHVASV